MFLQARTCLVLSPSSALWDQQTILLLHGAGGNARSFAEAWRPLVDEGWTLVVPQASGTVLSPEEVRVHLDDCRTKRGLDPSRIVAAGVAQGAQLAFEIASEFGLPWLCVNPAFPPGYSPSPLEQRRGVFLLSESEPGIAAFQGIEIRRMPGNGQTLPADFSAHASKALKLLELG